MDRKLVIIGRPNVGKSTLFNRLAGRKLAIVHETPGVTRDRKEAPAQLGDLRFTVIDTAGLEEAPPESLQARMTAQTEHAVAQADVALLLIDAREGVTPADRHFARWLRKVNVPVVLAANKCDTRESESGLLEAYSLGLGEPIAISAAHGEGLADLYAAIERYFGAAPAPEAGETGAAAGKRERPIKLAVVGRPNVGKSTLVNRLLEEERMLTGPEPGITRDAIAVPFTFEGRALELVDTAGVRRRARIGQELERLSVAETLRVVRLAEVVILVVDANAIFEQQDLAIARIIEEEGRAMVIALNKWDIVEDRTAAVRRMRDALEAQLPQVKGVGWIALSALTAENVDELMPAVLSAYEIWNRRVPTHALNRWLAKVQERHPPPAPGGKPIQLRYTTQVKARPPTFALFANKPELLPDSYSRYLANSLREEFGLAGTPLRFVARRGKNPYAPRPRTKPKRASKRPRRTRA
ncbi:MAG TPA: ribosome biogenesis GTPase Der [Alphaproteobacteria bacterium]|nr:ribosome biogenesis GTPase Der [Alphaproteobacteria bacterium]